MTEESPSSATESTEQWEFNDPGVIIPLTNDGSVVVSPEDVELVSTHRWRLARCRRKLYAESTEKVNGKWKKILLHRFILRPPSDMLVDHKNNNGLDCRRCNLRLATHTQNQRNAPSRIGSSSKFKGVWFADKPARWLAQICDIYLGTFSDEVLAAEVYDHAAVHIFGEFAWLNYPSRRDEYAAQPFYSNMIRVRRTRGENPYVGTQKRGNSWLADCSGYPQTYRGSFATGEAAAMAYDLAKVRQAGTTAKVNFPERMSYYLDAILGGVAESMSKTEFKKYVRDKVRDYLKGRWVEKTRWMGSRGKQDRFAGLGWYAEDVIAIMPSLTDVEAASWLARNDDEIRERIRALGADVIKSMLETEFS